MNGCDPRRIANRMTLLAFTLAAACGGAADPSAAGDSATAALTTLASGGAQGASGNPGAPGWFRLQANPGVVQLAPDGTASATVSVARGGGFTGPVNLSADLSGSGLPVEVAFEPASVTTSEATMVITVGAQPATGAWPAQTGQVLIRGEAGGATELAFVVVSAATPWGASSSGASSPGATPIGSGGATLSATPGSNVTGCASAGLGDLSLGALLAGLGLARGAGRRRRRGPCSHRR